MRRIARFSAVALLCCVLLTGCYDRTDMEKTSFALVWGVDVDGENRIVNYTSTPVFSKSVSKKSLELKVESNTLRQGRGQFDTYTIGAFTGRKTQAVVLSKRFVQQVPDWFRYMDVYFRDGRNPISQKMIIFDGPLDDLFHFHTPSQPMLPLMLTGMLETTYARSEGVRTSLRELHRQMYEEGQTPYIDELKIDQDTRISGAALLNHRGKYVVGINAKETLLLRVLQKTSGPAVSLTLQLPPDITKSPPSLSWLSLTTERIQVRIKPSYADERFRFDVGIRIAAGVMEKLPYVDIEERRQQIEAACAEQIRLKFQDLIDKLRKNKVDPVGFGIYARAYEHAAFERVKSNWGEAFGRSDVRIRVQVSFADEGSVK